MDPRFFLHPFRDERQGENEPEEDQGGNEHEAGGVVNVADTQIDELAESWDTGIESKTQKAQG